MARRSLSPQQRARGVTAVLGPTNTGKTHLAIERMLGHRTGMIGLPLRLLAREVYARVVERVGPKAVALVTGEEKIRPAEPARYWISTVEAMPRDLDLDFVAVDEIQLANDLDRGHVFTDRLLNQRGRHETLLIGAATMRPLIEALIPGVHVISRPRLSRLSFAGEKKLSRLPPRTAIVAFSAEEVYAVAELIRRQRGGAAVVLGALSPRTRNHQVEMYQAGEVQYLVATDAIGMGLNLDVDHVAFAADRKYDGFRFRKLYAPEMAQIAGRAGRYLRDGTFGSTGRCPPFDAETVQAIEDHHFDPVRIAQWRNPDLDFRSLAALQESLAEQPRERGLLRAPMAEDVAALELLARDDEIRRLAANPRAVERLWGICQVPDYRKVAPQTHADLVGQLYRFLMVGMAGRIPADWFARHVALVDRTDGDIAVLSNRIAQIRTWTFVANRPDWLADPEHWQGVTRAVEDKLSDALHERLAQRFVDRRTSVLMRRLRENAMLDAEINAAGDVTVEGQHVGQLHGFQFVPDPLAEGTEAKALRAAAAKALAGEIEARAERFAGAADATLVLSNDGTLRWTGDPVAKLEPGDALFEPRLRLLADEHLAGPAREKVEARLKAWLKAHITRLLGPVMALQNAAEITGLARGIAFQVAEALGVLERGRVAADVRSLDQDGRGQLRRAGVRFGAYHLYLPALLKPAPRTLAAQLWALRHGGLDQPGIDTLAHLAGSGRTSFPADPAIQPGLYRAAGFRVAGGRAVRVDILERLADLIRPAIAYRPGVTAGEPPPGAADGDGFVPTGAMTSLVGCSGEDFAAILRSLGYVSERRPGPPITVPLAAAAPAPEAAPASEAASAEAEGAGDAPSEEALPDSLAALTPDEAAAPPEPDAPLPGDGAEPSVAEAGPDSGEPEAEPSATFAELASFPVSGEVAPALHPPEGEGIGAAGPAASGDEAVPAEAHPVADAPGLPAEGADVEAAPSDPTGTAGDGEIVALVDAVPPAEALQDATAVPDSAGTVPAEPVPIEVWRQHRPQRDARRGERRPERNAGRPARPGRGEGAEAPPPDRAERRAGERPGGQRSGPNRPPERGRGERRGAPPERAPRPEGGEAAPSQEAGSGPRRDERRGPPRQGWNEGRGPGGNRPGQGAPSGPDRRREAKAPDPNSPFAKLAALKAQLEGRGDKR